ncbi:unnamed protein product [Nippostrongylus brasiliensis]|uniref:Putative limd1 (inferred by orthology to a S. mansoni protein) n=1 Tax=Nippostrongylus brasiliensis TaxID=27835 RepID=A0A0N4YY37_NIPBR|nr:unnamed protein product [Nippostrongylus brasiliensis]
MYDSEDRYTVNDATFHRACFTCEVCGRELRDQQFYLSEGRFYCKQDYLFNMEKKVTRCAECKQPIEDMVLSALSRNYHPACFRCTACGICLDGVQFALDKNNQITGETVRIVALDNNYHVDCYSCEGCGLKLTDEDDACCYPLGKHLLCEKCHIHWRRAGPDAPISDL